jgi:uncharacterized cupredoxin-like copper-binding protein
MTRIVEHRSALPFGTVVEVHVHRGPVADMPMLATVNVTMFSSRPDPDSFVDPLPVADAFLQALAYAERAGIACVWIDALGSAPSRIIQVTMQELDAKMLFVPSRVEIRKGEQIKFVLHNTGKLDHEFVLATTQENLEHAEMMKKNPEMRHDDPNARRVAPKQTSQIVWRFIKAGEFEFACLIPGHRDAGMFGIVDVK